jgi:OOP family OmpA-OmpF porin
MKQLRLSLIALLAMGSIGYAGGDISPVTEFETEDILLSEEEYVEPIIEEPYVAPVVEVKAVPVPLPVPEKKIVANGFYAGLGIAASKYKTNCDSACSKSGEDKTAGVMGRVGYDFNQYIGLEARGIKTNWKSDGGKVEHAGIFVKPMLPVADTVNVYGLIGVAKTKTDGHLQKTDTDSLALGAGVEVDLSKDTPKEGRYNRTFDGQGDQEKGVGVFLDYERMVVKSGSPDLDAVSAGVTYDF